jgi:ribonuclease HII
MTRKIDPCEIPAAPDLRFERALWASGLLRVVGLDEAGRGAWAGPVVAGAVILPPQPEIQTLLCQVRDSKQLAVDVRNYCAEQIKTHALAWAAGAATNEEIDALGIVPATRLAMTRALSALPVIPQHLLIDALPLPAVSLPQTCLIKGDARALSIAAASIIAKTTRDRLMTQLDTHFPLYGFARHKGYGTSAHWTALQNLGPCAAHRYSFEPVQNRKMAE